MQTGMLHCMKHLSSVLKFARWQLQSSCLSYQRVGLSQHGHIRSRAPLRSCSTIRSLFGTRDGFQEVAKELKNMRQAIAALSDPQGRLSERAAREHLRLDTGAVFDTAYEVAWYIMGEEPQALGPAVERLVSSVIEQDAGAQGLLQIMQQQIRKDVASTSEVTGPVQALTSYLMGRRSPAVVDDKEIKDATTFMAELPLEPQEVLKAIQQLKEVLRTRDNVHGKGWWLPYFDALVHYYAAKLNRDSSKLKDVVAGNFVMLALPVALEPNVFRSPVDVLEVDLLWPIDFDGLGGCEIRIGEAKSRATSANVQEARKQLARSLLFLEWACKQVYGDCVRRISLKGVIALLDTGPDKKRFSRKIGPTIDSAAKINFSIVKV